MIYKKIFCLALVFSISINAQEIEKLKPIGGVNDIVFVKKNIDYNNLWKPSIEIKNML